MCCEIQPTVEVARNPDNSWAGCEPRMCTCVKSWGTRNTPALLTSTSSFSFFARKASAKALMDLHACMRARPVNQLCKLMYIDTRCPQARGAGGVLSHGELSVDLADTGVCTDPRMFAPE